MAVPNDYYTMQRTGEDVDTLLTRLEEGNIIIPSSTAGSTKKFRLIVTDAGAVSAVEVAET